MLEGIGLKDLDVRMYRYVICHPGCSLGQVIESTGLSRVAAVACRDRLSATGLLMVGEQGCMHHNPSGPEVMLERLRVGIDAEYNEKRRRAAALHGELSQIVGEGLLAGTNESGSPVDVLTNCSATRVQLLALINHTKHELLRMWNKPSQADATAGPLHSTAGELKALRRGVDVRIICPSSSLLGDRPLMPDGIGTTAMRVVTRPPVSLHVFDRRVAVLEDGSDEKSSTSFVIHGPPLVRVLYTFFEMWWGMGRIASSDADAGGGNEHYPSAEDLVLLQFLSDGVKDENVARQLSLSVRTVRRKISSLLNRLEASSRFQAGVLAARRGWI